MREHANKNEIFWGGPPLRVSHNGEEWGAPPTLQFFWNSLIKTNAPYGVPPLFKNKTPPIETWIPLPLNDY